MLPARLWAPGLDGAFPLRGAWPLGVSERRAQLRHAEWLLDHLPPRPAQEVGNARLLGLGGYEDYAGDDGRPLPGNLVVFSGRPW